tara:strand:- start:8741 stop:9412 length:672 start_codon:yes stop_codon:yes gene_type:complete
MGFVVNNSFGKFQAEADIPLPTFSAESLMSLPSKQFGAATIDSANITNYDDANFSRFSVGDGGTGAGAHTTNVDGAVRTAYDKGFHFTLDNDADIVSQTVNLSRTGQQTFSFDLKPGDSLFRDGRNKNVVYVPADGSERVTTEVPWIRGGSYNITLDEVVPVIPAGGDNGNGTENGGDDGNGGNGGNGGDDDTEEDETNYLLYGGIAALVVVGGIFASKMLKK